MSECPASTRCGASPQSYSPSRSAPLASQPGAGPAAAGDAPAIELRVWQHLEDGLELYVSARAADGLWESLGIIPLPLDGGPAGSYRYGDITLAVPLGGGAPAVAVELRLWQHLEHARRLHLSVRLPPQSWEVRGTVPVTLDGGLHAHRPLRYGDLVLGEGSSPGEGASAGEGSALREDGVAWLAGEPGRSDYRGVAADRDGSLVVADYAGRAIRRILPDGTVTTIAGGKGSGTRDGPGESAQFTGPSDVAIDPEGAIFVADSPAHSIRRIAPDGTVTTVTGFHDPRETRWRPRDGRAEDAVLVWPSGLAFSPTGDLYIMEQIRIRRLSPSGRVTTFAGGRGQVYRDGRRDEAQFASLRDIDVDAEGNVYVIDANGYVPGGLGGTYDAVRMIATSGRVSTLLRSDPPWEGGVLAGATGIAVTPGGEVYVSNTGRHQIVRIEGRRSLVAVAGSGGEGFLDGPRDRALFRLPGAIDITPGGAIVVSDQDGAVIRLIRADAGGDFRAVGEVVAREVPRLEGVGISRVERIYGLLDSPQQIAFDTAGNIIVANAGHHAISRISPEGSVNIVAGGAGEGSSDGPRGDAQFSRPEGVAVDDGGVIYVADTGNGRIRRIALDGTVSTVAGRDHPLSSPSAIAFDLEGTLLVTERDRGRIRRLSPAGELSILVDEPDFTGGLAVDEEGTAFYAAADPPRSFIRSVDGDGIVSAVFSDPPGRYGGLLSTELPGIAVAPDGTLYVADLTYGRVVRISPDGAAAIVVDRESMHRSGNFRPAALLLTPDGDLLVADSGRDAIWRITLGGGGE